MSTSIVDGGSYSITIDSNNNDTTMFFRICHDAEGSNELFKVVEAGVVYVYGNIDVSGDGTVDGDLVVGGDLNLSGVLWRDGTVRLKNTDTPLDVERKTLLQVERGGDGATVMTVDALVPASSGNEPAVHLRFPRVVNVGTDASYVELDMDYQGGTPITFGLTAHDDYLTSSSGIFKLNAYKGAVNVPFEVASLSADPSNVGNGALYYNTSTNRLRLRANGSWVDLN